MASKPVLTINDRRQANQLQNRAQGESIKVEEDDETQPLGQQTYKKQKLSTKEIIQQLQPEQDFIKAASKFALQSVDIEQQPKLKLQILKRLVQAKNKAQTSYEQSTFEKFSNAIAQKTGISNITKLKDQIDKPLIDVLDKFIYVRVRRDGTKGYPIARRIKFATMFPAQGAKEKILYRKARTILRQLKNLLGVENLLRNGANSVQVLERAQLSNRATQSNPSSIFNKLYKAMIKTQKILPAEILAVSEANIAAGLAKAQKAITDKVALSINNAISNTPDNYGGYLNAKEAYKTKYGTGTAISDADIETLSTY